MHFDKLLRDVKFFKSYGQPRRIVRLNPLVAQGLDVIYCGTTEMATVAAAAIVCGLSLRDEMAQKVEAKSWKLGSVNMPPKLIEIG